MRAEWQWYDWERGHVYVCRWGECVGACASVHARARVCVCLYVCVYMRVQCVHIYLTRSMILTRSVEIIPINVTMIYLRITAFSSKHLLVNTHECRFVSQGNDET